MACLQKCNKCMTMHCFNTGVDISELLRSHGFMHTHGIRILALFAKSKDVTL